MDYAGKNGTSQTPEVSLKGAIQSLLGIKYRKSRSYRGKTTYRNVSPFTKEGQRYLQSLERRLVAGKLDAATVQKWERFLNNLSGTLERTPRTGIRGKDLIRVAESEERRYWEDYNEVKEFLEKVEKLKSLRLRDTLAVSQTENKYNDLVKERGLWPDDDEAIPEDDLDLRRLVSPFVERIRERFPRYQREQEKIILLGKEEKITRNGHLMRGVSESWKVTPLSHDSTFESVRFIQRSHPLLEETLTRKFEEDNVRGVKIVLGYSGVSVDVHFKSEIQEIVSDQTGLREDDLQFQILVDYVLMQLYLTTRREKGVKEEERKEKLSFAPYFSTLGKRTLPIDLVNPEEIRGTLIGALTSLLVSLDEIQSPEGVHKRPVQEGGSVSVETEEEKPGSMWVFLMNTALYLDIYKYNPGTERAGSYLPTPRIIEKKKAVLNINNGKTWDCFQLSVTAHFHPVDSHGYRPQKYRPFFEEYDFSMFEDAKPVPLRKLPEFESRNNVNVTVYDYEVSSNPETQGQTLEIFPRYLSKYNPPDGKIDWKRWINLLRIKGEGDEDYHYVLVKSLSRLLGRGEGHSHPCPSCLHQFKAREGLENHLKEGCLRFGQVTILPEEEESKEYVKFRDFQKMDRCHDVIYCDLESILETDLTVDEAQNGSYQRHRLCGYCVYQVSSDNPSGNRRILYRGPDAAKRLLTELKNLETAIQERLSQVQRKRLTEEERRDYNHSENCRICGEEFCLLNPKEESYNRYTGEYTGAIHRSCNVQRSKNFRIPVVIHNGMGYDIKLMLKELEDTGIVVNCIPQTTEKFVTVSIDSLQVIDSLKFLPSSLDTLVSSLKRDGIEKFKSVRSHFNLASTVQLDLLTKKGIYPYDYMDSFQRFDETELPNRECFLNRLRGEDLVKDPQKREKMEKEKREEYDHAVRVWKEFQIQNLGEYHDLYLTLDVLLLADVFEHFRDLCLRDYRVDPVHFFTAPSMFWSSMLLQTGVKLDVFSDPDMYLFVEKGIRGGVSVISHRYARANRPDLPNYDPSLPPSSIVYLDANNLYGWAMCQSLPMGEYQWSNPEEFTLEKILGYGEEEERGYILKVDLEYPPELHDSHNCYPLAPETVTIPDQMTSPYSKNVAEKLSGTYGWKRIEVPKLVPNLLNKSEYIVHISNLKYYLQKGMKLQKVHKVLSFKQSKWMKPYIESNTQRRALAKSSFEKDFYKLANNAVFGKCMENVRKRIDFTLVTDPKKYQKLVNQPTFKRAYKFNGTLHGVSRIRKRVVLDKPIAVGMAILDLSKLHMYRFHYDVIKANYGSGATLLMTDTDSLVYQIETENVYEDMRRMSEHFDSSEYPKWHPNHDPLNKKVVGKFKDEACSTKDGLRSKEITEFIGLRAKMYSYRFVERDKSGEIRNQSSEMRGKGLNLSYAKNSMDFNSYQKILNGKEGKELASKFYYRGLKSELLTITSREYTKIGLSAYDDKRYLEEDGIRTLAYGHRLI